MDFISMDDDSLRKVCSYLSFRDHFNLVFVDPRFEGVVYTACKYIYVKLTLKDLIDQPVEESSLDSVFYRLITGKADEAFKEKYPIFKYIEKLHLDYRIDEPIDLGFLTRLNVLNLNFTRANSKCPLFVEGKVYAKVRTLYVRDYKARYQELFPEVKELGCEFLQNDIRPSATVQLLCMSAIYPDEFTKFTNLKMISLDLNHNLFNTTPQLCLLLTRVPTLTKLHINFSLRKNTLSTYTRAISRLVNLKAEHKLNLDLCVHLNSFTKDHPTVNTYSYRDNEVTFFRQHAEQFLQHLVSFQINEVELTNDTLPDTVALFKMVGTQVIEERELIPFIGVDSHASRIGSYLKNLKTVKLTLGTDDQFFIKLAKLTSTLKTIEITCAVEQRLLNSIADHYKDITHFTLYDQTKNAEYDIGFLLNLRHLRSLVLQFDRFKEIAHLQTIVSNCIFLNFLTINSQHYEQVKGDLLTIYKARSVQYPFTTIMLTIKFDPFKCATPTLHEQITERFSVHFLPDLSISQEKA